MHAFREFMAAAQSEMDANLRAIAGHCEDRTRKAHARGDEELLSREIMAQAVTLGALYRHFRNVVVKDPQERVMLDDLAEAAATVLISVPAVTHELKAVKVQP